MTNSQLVSLLTHVGVGKELATQYGNAYSKLFKKYSIDAPKRISAFFGNVLLECNYFRQLVENLNYSAQGLANTWPARYSVTKTRPFKPNELANKLNRNPKAIANNCYANRMGNGCEASGEGYLYRGRGPIQTTGKNGYIRVSKGTGLDVVNNPDILTTVDGGAEASCFYWSDNNLNRFADIGDFDGVCDMINIGRKTTKVGDSIHYTTRLNIYNKALSWFKANPEFSLDTCQITDFDEITPEVADDAIKVILEPVNGWEVNIDNGPNQPSEQSIIEKDLCSGFMQWLPEASATANIELYPTK
jgi:putative chitinase